MLFVQHLKDLFSFSPMFWNHWLFQYSLSLSHHFKGFAWLYQCSYYSITPFYQCTLIFPNISKAQHSERFDWLFTFSCSIAMFCPTFLMFCPCSYSIARFCPVFLQFSPMSPESCPRSYSQGSTNFKNSSSQQNILVARKIYLFPLPSCPHIYTHNLLSGPYFKFNHWSSKSTKVFVNNWNGIVTSIV